MTLSRVKRDAHHVSIDARLPARPFHTAAFADQATNTLRAVRMTRRPAQDALPRSFFTFTGCPSLVCNMVAHQARAIQWRFAHAPPLAINRDTVTRKRRYGGAARVNHDRLTRAEYAPAFSCRFHAVSPLPITLNPTDRGANQDTCHVWNRSRRPVRSTAVDVMPADNVIDIVPFRSATRSRVLCITSTAFGGARLIRMSSLAIAYDCGHARHRQARSMRQTV